MSDFKKRVQKILDDMELDWHIYHTKKAGSWVRGGYRNEYDTIYIKRRNQQTNDWYNGKRLPNGIAIPEALYQDTSNDDYELTFEIVNMCTSLYSDDKIKAYIQQHRDKISSKLQEKESEIIIK